MSWFRQKRRKLCTAERIKCYYINMYIIWTYDIHIVYIYIYIYIYTKDNQEKRFLKSFRLLPLLTHIYITGISIMEVFGMQIDDVA